jgi:hypothetical protein
MAHTIATFGSIPTSVERLWPIRGEFFLHRQCPTAQVIDLAKLSPEVALQIAALLRLQVG